MIDLFARAYRNLSELGDEQWDALKPQVIARSKKGDAAATYILGFAAEMGTGEKRDRARARKLYETAADRGDTNAMYRLGLLVQSKAKAKAKALYEKAGSMGHGGALFQRGKMERTTAEARPFWIQAAGAGDVAAMVALAERAEAPDNARQWWVRAAEAGSPMALYQAVERLRKGQGGQKDPVRARELLSQHAFPAQPFGPTGGEMTCQWWYAQMLARGEGGDVDPVLAAFFCTLLVRGETEHARKAKTLLKELTASLSPNQLAEIERRIREAPYGGVRVLARP